MNNKKTTKRALISSLLSLVLCMSMLIGTTFAWFTDSVTSATNTIKAGNLDIAIVDANDEDLSTISFVKANGEGTILWEPGCTYKTQEFYIKNNGNLDLKYEVVISGLTGDTDLLNVIDFTFNGIENGAKGTLKAGAKTNAITISGHMDEDAGNDYMNKSLDGVSITVNATQLASEYDSFDNQYDKFASYTEVSTEAELRDALAKGGDIVLAADITAADNEKFDIPASTTTLLDLNGYTLTSKDGGDHNWMAIDVNEDAHFTLEDSSADKTGTIVSSCYGVYVNKSATFVMNGGNIIVRGNGTYDFGVTLFNGNFVMNGGTITASVGVYAYDYYADAQDPTVVINDGNLNKEKETKDNYEPEYIMQEGSADITINGGTFDDVAFNENGDDYIVVVSE